MKNYAEMTDTEINFEVARHSFDAGWLERHYGKEGMVPDYCNNWDDAGPIIVESKIGLQHFNNGVWQAHCRYDPVCHDKNPLRAAMIVFLMMKDSEARILVPDEVSDA